MPRLKAARMTDATLVSSVDNETGALERDLADIFGIPLDTEITSPIFGSVNSTGTIAGIVKFLTNNPAALDYSVGIEVEDSSSADRKFRIVTYGGDLNVYQWNDGTSTWDLKQTLNDPISSIEDLDEVGSGFLAANTEKVLQVNAAGDAIIGISASAAGAQALEDLTDVPAYGPGDALKILQIEDSADPSTTQWVSSAGASGANNIYELNDVDEVALVAAKSGDILQVNWDDTVMTAAFEKYLYAYANLAGIPQAIPSGSWTQIEWGDCGSLVNPGTANAGVAMAADWTVIGYPARWSPLILLNDPGLYLIMGNITWEANLNGTHRKVQLVRDSGAYGGGYVQPTEYEPPFRLKAVTKTIGTETFVNLEKVAVTWAMPYTGYWHVENFESYLKLQVWHNAGSTVDILNCSMSVFKMR